jgi:homogentisate 1,2-dioxygenase
LGLYAEQLSGTAFTVGYPFKSLHYLLKPGGASLHSILIPHGPDAETVSHAQSKDTSKPEWIGGGNMAFMFDTSLFLKLPPSIINLAQSSYQQCWQEIPDKFVFERKQFFSLIHI